MKRSVIIFILLGSFIGGIFWYGNTIPRERHTSVSQTFKRNEQDIRELILHYQQYPKWRENVYAVKEIPSKTKYHAWKETNGDGKTTPFQLLNLQQNGNITEITLEITGEEFNTLGRWHFKITGHDDGLSSTVTITEDKIIPNLISRVVKQLLSSSTENIDSYFRSINNKFVGDMRRTKHLKPKQKTEPASDNIKKTAKQPSKQ